MHNFKDAAKYFKEITTISVEFFPYSMNKNVYDLLLFSDIVDWNV